MLNFNSLNSNFDKTDKPLQEIWQNVKTKKIKNIFVLRFVAAVLVILFHAFQWIYAWGDNTQAESNASAYLLLITTPCVDTFLLCTGFISFNKKRQNWKKYFILFGVFFLLNFIFEINNIKNGYIDYWSIFLPIIFGNAQLWFMKVYFVFTPLVPYLNKVIQKKRDAFFFIIFFIILYLFQYTPIDRDWWISTIFWLNQGVSLVQFICLYLLGRAIIFFLPTDNSKHWYVGLILYIISVVLSIVCYLYLQKTLPIYNYFQVVLMAVAICLCGLMIKLPDNKLTTWLVKLGELSLWFYLFNIFSINFYISPIREWFHHRGGYFLCAFLEVVWHILVFTLYLVAKKYAKKSLIESSHKKKKKKKIKWLVGLFDNYISYSQAAAIYYIFINGSIKSSQITSSIGFNINDLYLLMQKNIIIYTKSNTYEINRSSHCFIEAYLELLELS